MTTPTPGVALTMIVKNEEPNLPACLESVHDLVDEIVIVDTGSEDRTKEIALSYGAKVFDFEWVDSFAAARNESLRLATREWIFWLDADDRCDQDNRVRLRALFSRLPQANVIYGMTRVSLLDIQAGTKRKSLVENFPRLFRNDPRVRWRYRVHEQIVDAVLESGGEVHTSDVVIRHTGYEDRQLRRLKYQRNLRLLWLENSENPNNPFILGAIGQELLNLNQKPDGLTDALPYLQQSLALSGSNNPTAPFITWLIAECHARLGRSQQALDCCREGLRKYPNNHELLSLEMRLSRPITPGVSLCMIVRNEESNIASCLESVHNLVDEIVIIDTGSKDRTKEIALAYGANVFDFQWVDSFAAARNESLRQATREWIFWLDADDRLDEENRGKLKALFSKLPAANVAYYMKCMSLYDVPYDGGTTTTVCDQVRLFRNDPRIRWKYRCHEQISDAVSESGGEFRWSDIIVTHTGYLNPQHHLPIYFQDPHHLLRKSQRNLPLLQLENCEHPNDQYTLYNIGATLFEMGQVAEALPCLQESLALSDSQHARCAALRAAGISFKTFVSECYLLISMCHAELWQSQQALQVCREGLKKYPNNPELLSLEMRLTYAPKIVCQYEEMRK